MSVQNEYKHLLPRSQHAVFDQLGTLKNFIVERFLAAGEGISVEVAVAVLDVMVHCNKQDEKFRKSRDRFFTAFLTGEIHGSTLSTLQKILEISRTGFFEDFLYNVSPKKKNYHTSEQIIAIVDEFRSQILPTLSQREESRNSFTEFQSHPIAASSSSVSQQNLWMGPGLSRPQIIPISSSRTVSITSSPSGVSISKAYENVIQCLTFFALPKQVNEFLALLPRDRKWKQETYDAFSHLLNIEHNLHFDDFEKLRLCRIIFCLHSPSRTSAFEHCSEIDVREFVNLCWQLKFKSGEEVLELFCHSLNDQSEFTLIQAINILNLLLAKVDQNDYHSFIQGWVIRRLHGQQVLELLQPNLLESGMEDAHFHDDIDSRLARFKNDLTVTQPLSDADLELIQRQYQIVDNLCREFRSLEFNELMNMAHSIRQFAIRGPIAETDRLKLIAIARLAILIEFKIYPYSTQILALLGLFADGKSRQAQVKTGEGKSTIVALWAFVMAMECRAVDIITSARYLAIRDHDKFAKFFKRCGITTGHICFDRKLPKHFRAQILYAPAFDFEFAWMGDRLNGSKLYQKRLDNPFVKRNFDAVCVDESDNLLIDTSRNGARLAYPSEQSFDWVYAPILSFVRQKKELVENRVDDAVSELREYLGYHLSQENQRACSQLSNDKFKIWLKSAFQALFEISEDKEYVVRAKRNSDEVLERAIQIVDIKTGRISENSRWSNGIHEFLEVKHDIVVERESLTAISLSHAVFYQFYQTISALTGTAERFQTREIYQIDSFDVPPHRLLKRIDLPSIIATNRLEYLRIIVNDAKECIQQNRPILILCETIQETRLLGARLREEGIELQLLNEVQEELEEVILSQAGRPRKVTVATNTAGRGTDIILPPESLQNGGLHVLLTFYPDSKRVEDQAIGRAGRQGQPGSSRMILNKEDPLIQDLISKSDNRFSDDKIIKLLNKQRELQEKSQASEHRVSADLDRFLAEKTHLFYDTFSLWSDYVTQDLVLEKFAGKLSSIKLNPRRQLNFDNLIKADLIIAVECKRLLIEKPGMLPWKVFLQRVVERIKDKSINEWVRLFFEPTEKQLKEVGRSLSNRRAQFEAVFTAARSDLQDQTGYAIFSLIAGPYLAALDDLTEITKAEIDQKFAEYRIQWEKYFAQNGSGLFVYLKEITSIDLLPIILR